MVKYLKYLIKRIFVVSLIIFGLLNLVYALELFLKLPYEKGEKFVVTRRYETPDTHINKDKYAIDFTKNGCEAYGKPVLAVASGKVKYLFYDTGLRKDYGNAVKIDHGNNLESIYAHLKEFVVEIGQEIKQGQLIGYVGNTGYAKGSACPEYPGTHLHFAMYQKQPDGKLVAYKPEPMSGYGEGQPGGPFIAGNWYISDNELYKPKFVEEENIPWWKKFLGTISGFFNNVTQPVIHFVAQTTSNNQQTTGNNQQTNDNQKQIWSAEIISQSEKNLILKPSQTANLSVTIKNTGNQVWQPNHQVSINVFNQQAKNLYHSSWRTRLRPAVSNSVVNPGERIDFSFQIKGPNNPGNYLPSFQIVYTPNNSSFETIKSDLITWQIVVSQEEEQKIVENQPSGNENESSVPGSETPTGSTQNSAVPPVSSNGGGVIFSGGGGGNSDGSGGSENGEQTDTTPPETTITNLIDLPQATNSQEIILQFSANEIATFECKIDDQNFQSCTSPKNYQNLTEGSHQFQVRAIDSAGNVDLTPAQFSWTIDLSGPVVSLTSQPQSPTSQTSAQFEFSSTEQVIFECALDDAQWQTCTSPKIYENLIDGAHLFSLRAKDEVGNYSQPIDFAWLVDSMPPNLEITTKPNNPTNQTSAEFGFSANENVNFFCKLDDTNWQDCSSPKSYENLTDGHHNFYLKAKDQVDLETETFYQWTIDLTAPTSSIITTGFFNLVSWPGKIEGTVNSDNDLAKVEIEIQRSSDNKYLNYTSSTIEWIEDETWLETILNEDKTNWSFDLTSDILSDDIYLIKSRATDNLGNLENPVSQQFVFDSIPPDSFSETVVEEDSNLIFSWSGYDELSGIDYYQVNWRTDVNRDERMYEEWREYCEPLGLCENDEEYFRWLEIWLEQWWNGGNSINLSEPPLILIYDEENGTYYFRVRAIDKAGNYGEWNFEIRYPELEPVPC